MSPVELENRFKKLDIQIPIFKNDGQEEKILELKKWLGVIVMKVFSHSFHLFETEKLDKNKARSFCCANMIYCIIEVIRRNSLKEQDVKLID